MAAILDVAARAVCRSDRPVDDVSLREWPVRLVDVADSVAMLKSSS